MRVKAGDDREQWLGLAADQLRSALELLDRVDAPPHIAAQIDLALHQLEGLLGIGTVRSGLTQIERNAEPQ